MTCATVGVMWGLKWDDSGKYFAHLTRCGVNVYANSLSRCGYTGQKLMFVSDFVKSPDVNCDAAFENARMPESDFRELVDNLEALGFTVIPWTPDLTRHPSCDRWRPVLEYFAKREVPDWLILTDVGDVVFQSDPQKWLEDHNPDLVGAGESITVGEEANNRAWSIAAFGEDRAESIRDLEVCCHGTIAGKGPLTLQYITALHSFLIKHSNQRLVDQGVGNWLMRQPPFGKQLTVTHRDGLIGSYVWDLSDVSVRKGIIYPSKESKVPVPICHLYQTLPEVETIRKRHQYKILVGLLGWVGGDKEGSHEAMRNSWLLKSGLDYKFFIGDGTPLSREEEKVVQETYDEWASMDPTRPQHKEYKIKQKVDPKNYVPKPDDVLGHYPDGYAYLGAKRRESCRYALAHGYDYLFCCSIDVYARVERLLSSGFEKSDYSGKACGWPGDVGDFYIPEDYCFGGAYWLSRKAMKIIADAPITYWCEDWWVGLALRQGIQDGTIVRAFDPRYSVEDPGYARRMWGTSISYPTIYNDIISIHLSHNDGRIARLSGYYDAFRTAHDPNKCKCGEHRTRRTYYGLRCLKCGKPRPK